jgi:aminoglycoside phosphotransferase family enzyme/predicted kinase
MPASEKAIVDEEKQAGVVAFLSGADAYGADAAPETAETHVSRVFLLPDRAYKLKRAVKFPYLDFSDPAARLAACEDEVEINRRTAPDIYLGVEPIRRAGGGAFALGAGSGEIVDWVVVMRRFDETGLLDNMAKAGKLDRRMMYAVADAIAAFHADAEPLSKRGGSAGTRLIVENNAESFARAPAGVLDADRVAALNESSLALVEALVAKLDARRDQGCVRHCHGDLYLRNICLVEGRPTLFDAIEFNRDFADIDVLYDLAFLLMDLECRGLGRLASFVFNRYFDVTGALAATPAAVSVLNLFLAMRAAVRAHVDASQSAMLSDPARRRRRAEEAASCLELALKFLAPSPPRLVAVGGLSGSGKSRMSRELAFHVGAAPGARVVRTDVVRKRLFGVGPEVRLPDEAYNAEAHRRTYEAFMAELKEGLAQGHAVIADGVFAGPRQRDAVRALAAEMGVPFAGLWVTAPPEVLAERVAKRQFDASDATVDVLGEQLTWDLGRIDWTEVSSDGEKAATLARGLAALGIGAAADK